MRFLTFDGEETVAWRDEVQDHTVTQEMRFGPRQPALELQSSMSRMWSHNLVPGTSVWKQNGLLRGDQRNAGTAAFLVVALPVCLAG